MKLPTLKQIDQIRQQGLRPQVVGCIVNDEKKILLLFREEYNLWEFPQGGIENRESLKTALEREMEEETGVEFASRLVLRRDLIVNVAEVQFPSRTKGSRELTTDGGKEMLMEGKKYFFCNLLYEGEEPPNLAEIEYDDFVWASHSVAKFLANKLYQRGKRRITLETLNILRDKGIIG